jgi:hypothetical protein
MIKEEIEKMYQKGNSTQELWDYFKKELEDSIDENIPQKTAFATPFLPPTHPMLLVNPLP